MCREQKLKVTVGLRKGREATNGQSCHQGESVRMGSPVINYRTLGGGTEANVQAANNGCSECGQAQISCKIFYITTYL